MNDSVNRLQTLSASGPGGDNDGPLRGMAIYPELFTQRRHCSWMMRPLLHPLSRGYGVSYNSSPYLRGV